MPEPPCRRLARFLNEVQNGVPRLIFHYSRSTKFNSLSPLYTSTEEIKENTKSKHKEMPEPPCCRIVKLKETESTCSSIDLTAILDPRRSNTESALLSMISTRHAKNRTCRKWQRKGVRQRKENLRKEMENRRTLRRRNE